MAETSSCLLFFVANVLTSGYYDGARDEHRAGPVHDLSLLPTEAAQWQGDVDVRWGT